MSDFKTLLLAFGSGLHGNIAKFGFKSTQVPQEINLHQTPEKIYSNATDSVMVTTSTGEVYAWGRNENFVLGNPNNVDSSIPQQVFIPPVKSIALSSTHGVAITHDDHVYTWGTKALGRGASELSLNNMDKSLPTRIHIPAGNPMANLYSSTSDPGQQSFLPPIPLNNTTSDHPVLSPKPLSVGAGFNHSVAAMSDGTVWGWGCDSDGGIGLNSGDKCKSYDIPQRIPIPFNDRIAEVTCGSRHTLYKSVSGDLYSSGDNAHGQTGVPLFQHRWIRDPQQVLFPKTMVSKQTPKGRVSTTVDVKVDQMSCGPSHTCIISQDNDLYCWGNNSNGQLGLALSKEVNKSVGKLTNPVKNEFFANQNIKLKKVSCGAAHTAVIDTNDKLWVFGNGKEGQLSNLYSHPLSGGNYDTPIPINLNNHYVDGQVTQVELGNATTYIIGKPIDHNNNNDGTAK